MVKQILKQSVGIDMSKDSFYASFSQQEIGNPFRCLSSKKFDANLNGFTGFMGWIKRFRQKNVELHFLMEATGVYYEELAYFLNSKDFRVSVILPNKTKAFAKSLDYKSKTDKIDSKMLSQMALERTLIQWIPPSDKMLKIKHLTRERGEVLVSITAFKNRLHAKNHSYKPEASSISRTKDIIKSLEKQVAKIEQEIKALVASDPEIVKKIKLICTIPGVGLTTATIILAETNCFTLFKNKAQLVSYAGYDVVENQSGTSVKSPTRISKKGNHRIRKALYFPALTARKRNKNMGDMYNRVFENTKIKMKAYVAVQRKLLVLIYSIYKNDVAFDLNFKSVKKQNVIAQTK